MLLTPADDDPMAVDHRTAQAGALGRSASGAALYAGLPDEAVAVVLTAAAVVERHQCGYMPQDTAVGNLASALAAFIGAMRARYEAEQAGGSTAAA